MAKKASATISRHANTGKFEVRKNGGGRLVSSPNEKTPKTVTTSIAKNRDALKRLADR